MSKSHFADAVVLLTSTLHNVVCYIVSDRRDLLIPSYIKMYCSILLLSVCGCEPQGHCCYGTFKHDCA